ncbi:MAG: hypothetical protein HYZ74_02180 [Elusimicrobia bacterium]|nr:hypothetical protein [Elusimicrobiota bacterium]
MRRLALLSMLFACACAAPRPCTRTLCVTRLDGTMQMRGWSGTVEATSQSPQPPVPADSEVSMIYGKAEFRNGTTRVSAGEGTVFRFAVSTAAVASIEVPAGSVEVAASSAAAATVAAGSSLALPKAR